MMQSLLNERFKLVLHTETRRLPVLALVLAKPGNLGLRQKAVGTLEGKHLKLLGFVTVTASRPYERKSPILHRKSGDSGEMALVLGHEDATSAIAMARNGQSAIALTDIEGC